MAAMENIGNIIRKDGIDGLIDALRNKNVKKEG